jgi:hypothetical protein
MYYNKQWGRVPARRPPARLQSGATGTQASAGRESHWRPQHLADIHGNVPSTTLNDVVQQQASVLAYADISYVVATMSFAMISLVFIVRRSPQGKPLEAAIPQGSTTSRHCS